MWRPRQTSSIHDGVALPGPPERDRGARPSLEGAETPQVLCEDEERASSFAGGATSVGETTRCRGEPAAEDTGQSAPMETDVVRLSDLSRTVRPHADAGVPSEGRAAGTSCGGLAASPGTPDSAAALLSTVEDWWVGGSV